MSKEHRCPQCNQLLSHASKLERHMETHVLVGDWLCGLCNAVVNRLTALVHHWRNSCCELKQVFCEDELKKMTPAELKESAFRYTLDKHALEQQETDAEEAVAVAHQSSLCYFCHLYLPHGIMKAHYATHNGEKPAGSKIRNSVVPYFCDLCGYGFRFRKSLINHWRTKCTEVLVNIEQEHGVDIENRFLRQKVEELMKKAVFWQPPANRKDKQYAESEEESEDREDDDSEDFKTKGYPVTHDLFTGRIHRPPSFDRDYWNVDQKEDLKPRCPDCPDVQFASEGRLTRHQESFHPTRKPPIVCELCHARFKQNRILMRHLRESCRAIRVEEPDEKKRKNMSKEEMTNLVEKGKHRWGLLFEKKKEANLKFIEEHLAEIDRKQPAQAVKLTLEPPSPFPVGFVPGSSENVCEFCKVSFNNSRFLQQHLQFAHLNERPRNQLTITATSLLPYFRLSEAIFYNLEGRQFKMGRVLENECDLTKHFKERVIETGTRLNGEHSDCYIVQLQGERLQYVVLSEEEFGEVCGADGRLKTLFSENPKAFDDIPVLIREA